MGLDQFLSRKEYIWYHHFIGTPPKANVWTQAMKVWNVEDGLSCFFAGVIFGFYGHFQGKNSTILPLHSKSYQDKMFYRNQKKFNWLAVFIEIVKRTHLFSCPNHPCVSWVLVDPKAETDHRRSPTSQCPSARCPMQMSWPLRFGILWRFCGDWLSSSSSSSSIITLSGVLFVFSLSLSLRRCFGPQALQPTGFDFTGATAISLGHEARWRHLSNEKLQNGPLVGLGL